MEAGAQITPCHFSLVFLLNMELMRVIDGLKKGDEQFLKTFYYKHREAFLQYAQKFPLDEHDKVEVYQDAILALQAHAIKGNLDQLKSTIKTYLFSIAKFKIYDKLKKSKAVKLEAFKAEYQDQFVYEEAWLDDSVISLRQKLMQSAFLKLGNKCQELLTLYYYRGLSIKEICESMSYNNSNVVKAKKSQCLKKIKELIKS